MQTGTSGEFEDPAFSIEAEIRSQQTRVKIIHHAHSRMRQRGIEVDEVIACLRTPDVRNLDTTSPRKRWGRYDGTGRRRLDVVFEEEEPEGDVKVIVVISAMWGRVT